MGSWTQSLPYGIKKVGVFVDASLDEIERIRDAAGLDIVQLHGAETTDFCQQVGGVVWQVVHLDRTESVKGAQRSPASAILIDSYTQSMPEERGLWLIGIARLNLFRRLRWMCYWLVG